MNTQNDQDNAEDFETLYLAYRAKYEAAIRDAERYRHIRSHDTLLGVIMYEETVTGTLERVLCGDELDEAIDAVMASMLD